MAVPEDHGLVDVFGARDTFLQHPDRLHAQGDPEAAGGEARHVADEDALLADACAEALDGVDDVVAGAGVVDDLQQLHDEDRVEEVGADDPAGV